jgi:hypothetical protein
MKLFCAAQLLDRKLWEHGDVQEEAKREDLLHNLAR